MWTIWVLYPSGWEQGGRYFHKNIAEAVCDIISQNFEVKLGFELMNIVHQN